MNFKTINIYKVFLSFNQFNGLMIILSMKNEKKEQLKIERILYFCLKIEY